MTGNYGGEVLRHVWFFKTAKSLPSVFHKDVFPYFCQAVERNGLKNSRSLLEAIFHQISVHYCGQRMLAESQVTLRSPYLDNDLIQTVLRGPVSAFANDDLCARLVADGNHLLRQIPLDREQGREGFVHTCQRLTHNMLFKAEYAYDTGMPPWLARIDYLLSAFHLERLFLGRHKWYHFRIWYRDILSNYLREMLLDARTLSREYLDSKCVSAIVSGHLRGGQNYTTEIHKLLTLELIQRQLIEPGR
jgi:asparagine synthase (glutamine-hydrolysing)